MKQLNILGHTMCLTADADALISCRWLPDNADNTDFNENAEILENAETEITEYIQGLRREFTVPIRPEGTEFQMKVWAALSHIPYGETITYKELARRIGSPNACRAVANACGANPLPIIIPCHRVVASGEKTGGYTGGLDIKLSLLEIEKQNCRQ